VYREKAFDGTGWRPAEPLPVARELGENSIMFLVHPTLSEQDMARTVTAVGEVLRQAMGMAPLGTAAEIGEGALAR
jgi:dTDP-4-amino-4,6-dideoxygalactose transaminase